MYCTIEGTWVNFTERLNSGNESKSIRSAGKLFHGEVIMKRKVRSDSITTTMLEGLVG